MHRLAKTGICTLMSKQQRESGQRWIDERVNELAKSAGVVLDSVRWKEDEGGTYHLVARGPGVSLDELFLERDLEDLPADAGLKVQVEHWA